MIDYVWEDWESNGITFRWQPDQEAFAYWGLDGAIILPCEPAGLGMRSHP